MAENLTRQILREHLVDGDLTPGHPIALRIDNTDQRSKDYSAIAEKFRPGHADYTYWQKYGVRDYRGGGRQSARETAVRVVRGHGARAKVVEVSGMDEQTLRARITASLETQARAARGGRDDGR